jgi:long-chain acyl-CoA synthetase
MSEEEVRAMDTTSTEQITTGGMVRRWAAEAPEHVALRWEGGELTYRELDERSSRVAQALLAAGVGPGDRVAYLDKNGPEQVELLFGAAKVNAVPTPVNFRLAPPEIAFIVTDAQAKVFAVGEELLPLVEKVADELSGTMLVVIGESDAHPTFAAWRDGHPADDPMVPSAPDDVAYQLYSSGTTGRPKGVQLMQSNLAAGLPLYPSLMGLGTDSTSLVAMPLFHIGGGGWLLAGVAVGATNVLVREIVPAALVELIERERITHAFLVPAVLQFMLAVPGIEERDFSALRTFLYGASPISEQVLATSVRTFGCEFVQAYGLTETTGTVVILPAADHDPSGPNRHRLRAVGLAVPGSEVRVVDTVTGEDVAQGEVGEIWIRSPMVMKGYWNLPEATEDAIRPGGWFRSGDAGYRRRGRLPLHVRPGEGHDRLGWRERLPGRGRERPDVAPGRGRRGGDRHPLRALGRDAAGHGGAGAGERGDGAAAHRPRQGAPRHLQVPDQRRVGRGPSPQPERQGAQEGPAGPVLGGQGPARRLSGGRAPGRQRC